MWRFVRGTIGSPGPRGRRSEGAVEVTSEVVEDQSRDRIATRVPLRGDVEDPAADVWATIGGLLRNAFIESLRRGLEGGVGLQGEGG